MPTLNHGPERKLALITGATGGIGKATTVAFARQGWDLALHYNAAGPETRQQLEAAIKDAAPTQPKVAFFQADLGNFDSVRKLHADVASQLGEVDILFNNAGATGGVQGPKSIAEVSVEAFEQTWRINTGSTFLLTQLCVPHMESQGWGRIVFDSSVAGFTGGSIGPHYVSSTVLLCMFLTAGADDRHEGVKQERPARPYPLACGQSGEEGHYG